MKHFKFFITFLSCCLFIACASLQNSVSTNSQTITATFAKKRALTETEKQNWHFKDIYKDSIPGVSLNKAYDFLKDKKGDTIIVAVIDTELDIDHKDLKSQIWINKDEIPNNNIDDDNNGYVDDIHGWNFLANKNNESTNYVHFSSVRIIKKFDSIFKNISIDDLNNKEDKRNYENYIRAKSRYDLLMKRAKQDLDYIQFLEENYVPAHELVNKYFPNKSYTTKKLDSLYELKSAEGNKKEASLIYYVSDFTKYNLTKEWMQKYRKNADAKIDKILSLNVYDEREIIGDDPNNLNDSIYGGNNITGIVKESYHSTQVTGVLLNSLSKQNIMVMPICISSNGDEHDKDIAIAIHYAVNNGAKVINMSFGKQFSLNQNWVHEAFKYAEENGVLIVSSGGNNATDLDNDYQYHYPNDHIDNQEITNNFIKVGASNNSLDENLVAKFSNYGKNNIDIFAPGVDIYTTQPNNKYIINRGTSLATPMVSKVAALILSYYPNLTAAEVKQIIMESGVSYDIMVNKPSTSIEKELVPFSSLSKSGKIVNAYNALLMAEQVSKKKKEKKH